MMAVFGRFMGLNDILQGDSDEGTDGSYSCSSNLAPENGGGGRSTWSKRPQQQYQSEVAP